MRHGLVMWAGTMREVDLSDRVAAAAQFGYSAISMSAHDYDRARAKGLSDKDIRALLADAGVTVRCFDPFTRWLPDWEPPPGCPAGMIEFLNVSEADFLRAAEAVGATTMTIFEPFGTRWPDEVLAASLAVICERATNSGLRVNLEFIPFLGVPDLATAWRVVQLSGIADAGIVLDTWHYFRGTPDHDLLARIPGERIGAVQVSDAAATPVGDLEHDCLHCRLPPGTGSFPLSEVLRILSATGGLHDVGPEIFSDVFDLRSPAENLRAIETGLQPWLDAMRRTEADPQLVVAT